MSELQSGIVLQNGETLVMELEAEMWATSSNPIVKFIASIVKIICFIFGLRRNGYVVVTDKRVIQVLRFNALWCFNTGSIVKCILPSSIKEIGYVKQGTCCGCFCQAYTLYFQSFTDTTNVLLGTVTEDREAQAVVDAFYKAIFVANKYRNE